MPQRPRQSRRPSPTLRIAAALAAAAPVLALTPATQAVGESGEPVLLVTELPAVSPKPGEVRRDKVTLSNNGTGPAKDIAFRIRLTRGLAFPERKPGCVYRTHGQDPQALCRLDITLKAGASTQVEVPVKATSKALYEAVEYGTSSTGDVPGEGYDESYRQTRMTADNSADLAAVGDQASGRPGQTVSVTASLRNNGPGWVHNNESDDQPALKVTIPPGTVAVRVPSACVPFSGDGPSGDSRPGRPQYVCFPTDYTMDTGSVHSFPFRLRIGRLSGSTSGEVKVSSGYDIHPEFDHNAANDKAALTVRLPGHGAEAKADAGARSHPSASAAGRDRSSGTGSPAAGGAVQDGVAATSDAADGSAGKEPDADLASSSSRSTPYLATGAVAAATGLGGLVFLAVRQRRKASS